MRMANERDQAIVRSAVSDAAANLLAFVPSLGTREVIAFGEGVALPTRLKFKQLPEEVLPRSEALGSARVDPGRADLGFIDAVIERWRGATMSFKQRPDDAAADLETISREEFMPLQPAPTLDPNRFRILKKAADPRGGADALAAPVIPQRPLK
jgi:hypothetical protein